MARCYDGNAAARLPMSVHLYGTRAENLYVPELLEKKTFLFSAGEVQVRLPSLSPFESLLIASSFPSSQDIIEIVLLLNARNKAGFKGSTKLFLPYLPYSRQDRVCYPGEAFSIAALSSLLKTQMTDNDRVITWDAHSDVAARVFASFSVKFTNVAACHLIKKFGDVADSSYIVVSPDAGAIGRAQSVASVLGCETVIQGEKNRNSKDGSIVGISVKDKNGNDPDLPGAKVLIVDDICDGGRTFIELAKVLRGHGAKEIVLYVTHGIFSKGFHVFYDDGTLLIDRILTPNIFPGVKLPEEGPYTVGCHEISSPVPIVQILPPPLPLSPV